MLLGSSSEVIMNLADRLLKSSFRFDWASLRLIYFSLSLMMICSPLMLFTYIGFLLEKFYSMIVFNFESSDLSTFKDFLFDLNFDCLFLQNVIALVASTLHFVSIALNLFTITFLINYCLLRSLSLFSCRFL